METQTHQKNCTIETHRCYLRPFTHSDFNLLANLWNDEAVVEPMGVQPFTKNIEEKLNRYTRWFTNFGFTNFAVFCRQTNAFMGLCGVSLWHDPEHLNTLPKITLPYDNQEVEIGYMFHKIYWGQGIATETAQACMQFIYNNFPDIERVIAVTNFNHVKSQNVLRKLGFTFVTTMQYEDGSKEDLLVAYRHQFRI